MAVTTKEEYRNFKNSSVTKNSIYNSVDGLLDNQLRSTARTFHDTLVSSVVLKDFNVYKNWSSHQIAVDVDPIKPTKDWFKTDEDGTKILKKNKEKPEVQTKGVRSLFNKFHSVILDDDTVGWRISQNMPLLDSPKTRQLQRSINACTVSDLVQKSRLGLMGSCVYDWSDFMFCKYLGRVSNNHMITLRRFTIPVTDYVKPYGSPRAINPNAYSAINTTKTDTGGIPLGCMVTWLGTPGNEINNICKYSFSMPFKSINSKFEDDGATEYTPNINESKGLIGGAFTKGISGGIGGRLGNYIMSGFSNNNAGQSTRSPYPHYDANKAYANVDMIKSIYIRDADAGLKFQQTFSVVFDYELRSYDGVNGKQAMLDLLGNILTVCYTTGDFWPGAYRHNAHAVSVQPSSSLECMKHHKTFSGYVTAFTHDVKRFTNNIKSKHLLDFSNPAAMAKAILGLLDNLGGFLLGGDETAQPPHVKNAVNSLLSDTAVGQWHLTIGNPCAPIMSIGNLILKNCTVEHYGPLGIDDFPTGLKVTCEFDHGKPRDKRLIERMYNGGNDRIYYPLDQTVFSILKSAKATNQAQARNIKGKVRAGMSTSQVLTARRAAAQNAAGLLPVPKSNDGENINEYTVTNSKYETSPRYDLYVNSDGNGESLISAMKRAFGSVGPSIIKGISWAAGETNCGVAVGTDTSPAQETNTDPQQEPDQEIQDAFNKEIAAMDNNSSGQGLTQPKDLSDEAVKAYKNDFDIYGNDLVKRMASEYTTTAAPNDNK